MLTKCDFKQQKITASKVSFHINNNNKSIIITHSCQIQSAKKVQSTLSKVQLLVILVIQKGHYTQGVM